MEMKRVGLEGSQEAQAELAFTSMEMASLRFLRCGISVTWVCRCIYDQKHYECSRWIDECLMFKASSA